jgi:hypothetical protein
MSRAFNSVDEKFNAGDLVRSYEKVLRTLQKLRKLFLSTNICWRHQ